MLWVEKELGSKSICDSGRPEVSSGSEGRCPLDCEDSILDSDTACESIEPCSELAESGCDPGEGASSGLAILSPPRDCERLKSPSIVHRAAQRGATVKLPISKLSGSSRCEASAVDFSLGDFEGNCWQDRGEAGVDQVSLMGTLAIR